MSTDLQCLGKYELQERLGAGGMAEVWKAFDPQLQRFVALKIFHADLQNDPDFITRFWSLPLIAEAQLIVSLHHPNIVQILGFQISHPSALENPLAYVVMDYIEGGNLANYICDTSYRGTFPSAVDIVHLFASIGAGLDYAHQQGAIHGDIKPTNILLDKLNTLHNPMGEPMLNDIGITKLLGTSTGALSHLEPDMPFYISPEQAQGHPANERSDIYALGVILYVICTAELPFQGENNQAILKQHANAPPPSPSQVNSSISPALSAVIQRSLAKDPAERFPTAASMVTALAQALDGSVPEIMSQPDSPTNMLNGQTKLSPTLPIPSAGAASSEPSSAVNVSDESSSESSLAEHKRQDAPKPPPPSTLEEPSGAHSLPNPSSAPWQKLPGTTATASPLPATSRSVPRQKPSSTRRRGGPLTRKSRIVLLFTLLTLVVASTLGALFVLASRHTNTASSSTTSAAPPSRSQLARPSPQPTVNAQPTVTTTPVPASSPFPNLAKLYTGTLGDIPTGVTLKISLTSIQQQQDSISGYLREMPENNLFSQLPRNGPFQGTVNTSKEIQFTLMNDTGQATFSFNGSILADRSIQGSFCSLEATAGRCSDYGLWSVSPST